MHIVFNEEHYLDNAKTPIDLKQEPADIVILSFSDSDLTAFASAWKKTRSDYGENLPSLRLANIKDLTHNLSVDTYIENTIADSKCVLVRLIGGEQYWPYGLNYLKSISLEKNIALAIIPADGREDKVLDSYSNLPKATLDSIKKLCDNGGQVSAQAVLAQLSMAASLYFPPVVNFQKLPSHGYYCDKDGITETFKKSGKDKPLVCLIFYKSYLAADDLDPVNRILKSIKRSGTSAIGIFVNSLKNKNLASWLISELQVLKPISIINGTAFSAKDAKTLKSPLDYTECPVFQVIFSTSKKIGWQKNPLGLNTSDLAMHVALPEVDGRIDGGIVSFKSENKIDKDLQFSITSHKTEKHLVKKTIKKVINWSNLSMNSNSEKTVAIILSSYPGREYQLAHAIGLDTVKSTEKLINFLCKEGFKEDLKGDLLPKLKKAEIKIPIEVYESMLATLPKSHQNKIFNKWGSINLDQNYRDGYLVLKGLRNGNIFVLVQPNRGSDKQKKLSYHDLEQIPCHSYVAFYLWLSATEVNAIIHMGTHGSLEWLPGKSAGMSGNCWPSLLTNDIPVIYPFIVNDPGEASQAKRRIGAVTIGHMPPKLASSDFPNSMRELEFLLDEYSTSGDLDQGRKSNIEGKIIEEAKRLELDKELALEPIQSDPEWLSRIDSFVCDLKESQFSDGLHIFGEGECGKFEINAVLRCLQGKRIDAGPSGSPYRNRSDIKPTGRNIFAVDPRSIPTKLAFENGRLLADEFIRQYLQDNGEYPKNLTMDLWGSATMRTGGQEYSMAFYLAGVEPIWDKNNSRVVGFRIINLSELDRPRIDVTLRQSGLFRDIFPELNKLFFDAVEKLSLRDETVEDNPYKIKMDRIFAPKPGNFGIEIDDNISLSRASDIDNIGNKWLDCSAWAYKKDGTFKESREQLAKRLIDTSGLIHSHDLCESDLLSSKDYGAHIGGFNAAVEMLKSESPSLFHVDISDAGRPKIRTVKQEIARIIRGKLSNGSWVNGMMKHGFRGAAEITDLIFNLSMFSKSGIVISNSIFDLVFDSTLGNQEVASFIAHENPEALKGMEDRFSSLRETEIWKTKKNSIYHNERITYNG